MQYEAYEQLRGRARSPLALTCEHASRRLPPAWSWPPEDLHLRDQHWAWDLGAAALTRELAGLTGAPAVLARFTRLLIDPNRPLGSPTLLRSTADGEPIQLNDGVSRADRAARIQDYYRPYHAAVDDLAREQERELMLSIHSFTPEYEGSRREVAVGVLFDSAEDAGRRLERALRQTGLRTACNEPWSGSDGLMYCVEHHSQSRSCTALELEVRQDLATDPSFRAWFVPRVVQALGAAALLGVAACAPVELEGEGLTGRGWSDPFPSMHAMSDDGHVDLAALELPVPQDGTEVPTDRVAWREGFSPAQLVVLQLDEVDATALPDWREPTPGEGGVRMVDLDTGNWLPCMAELDAHPDAIEPSLLIRPLSALPTGHRIGVVLTTELTPRPQPFDVLLGGRRVPDDLAPHVDHYQDLVDSLLALGLEEDRIALAWDFPIADGSQPLRSALDQLDVPGGYRIEELADADQGDPVVPGAWRVATGSFDVQDLLQDDEIFADLDAEGSVHPVGQAEARLYVHIPSSVADAPAGSVPVVLFGHGIFSEPEDYLDDDEDPSGVIQLAEDSGWILIATTWRGLTYADLPGALSVAGDFGKLPLITDRLVQGLLNTHSLATLVREGDLLDDAIFHNRAGEPLPDRSSLLYYGISLGGIEGAVLLGTGAPIDRGVLHVGGAMWSTMLERSANWTVFEGLMVPAVPDPADRQLLYALSQLWWDAADPMSYTKELQERDFLLQESLGDEQVPNMSTRALSRSIGLRTLEPPVELPWGHNTVAGPVEESLLVQFDPELPLPEPGNRPAEVTGAHDLPRLWPGTHEQIRDFLLQGRAEHHCGSTPCSASNPGE